MTREQHVEELVLQQITPVLARTLRMAPGDASLAQLADVPPVLTMCMNPLNVQRAAAVADAQSRAHKRSGRLRAFAQLALHSHTLAARPDAKRAFWLRVLRSEMMDTSTSGVHECMLGEAASPRFVIDFSYSSTLDWDELLAFMTTTPINNKQRHRSARIALGLVFANCILDDTQLQALVRFLDALFAYRQRPFDIDVLDLSNNWLHAHELAVVAHIVSTCAANGVRELKLNNIVADELRDGEALAATPHEYLDVVRAVLGIPQAAPTSTLTLDGVHVAWPQATLLRRVTMSGNDVCAAPIAAFGSALRYSCRVPEFLSTGVGIGSSERKRAYWRWLAFALFYPRPKRLVCARTYALRRVGPIECTPEAIATMLETLHDPATELLELHDGTSNDSGGRALVPADACERSSSDALLVCRTRPGVCIELIGHGSEHQQEPPINNCSVDLEALCLFADGSVCVVVLGAGLGRVCSDDVAEIECEAPSQLSRLDGQYDLTLAAQEVGSDVVRFVRAIGPQIRSFAFTKTRFHAGALPRIVDACRSLEHLNLDACKLQRSDIDTLLTALEGDLGRRLLSLNLNCLRVGDTYMLELATILRRGNVVLQELRLHDTLRSLELRQSRAHTVDAAAQARLSSVDSFMTQTMARLVDSFDGQVLGSCLPIARKVAFLSVVRAMQELSDTDDSVVVRCRVIARLDEWLVRAIFAFAVDDVRRAIFLNGVIGAPGRHA